MTTKIAPYRAPRVARVTTLDTVAETWEISAEVSRALWAAMVSDDERGCPSNDWDPATWTEASTNRLDRAWKRLSEETRAAVVAAHKEMQRW